MRRKLIGAVILTLAAAGAAQAQNQNQTPHTLDDPVGLFFVPNPLLPCAMATVLLDLERTANLLLGFERTPECSEAADWFPDPTVQTIDNLSGMTIRQALDHLTMLAPTYEWRDMNGVAVVRPFNAWNDNANVLNSSTAAFTISSGRLRDTIAAALHMPAINVVISDTTVLANRQFSITFGGGTMLEALNAVIRAHNAAVWDLGWLADPSNGSRAVDVMVRTFDESGFSVGTTLATAAKAK